MTSHQHEQVLEELEVLRGRLAAAAVLSLTQLAIVLVYLIVTGVLYFKKCVKKHMKRQAEEEVELMEQKLQERKARRRATAAKAKAEPVPNQE